MDYKEKYEQACEKMKAWAEGKYPECFDSAQKTAELIFPELKESEDEKIRKAIIEFFELQDDNTTYSFIPKKDILAWIEKHKYTEEDLNKAYKCADEVQYRRGYEDAKKQLEKQGEHKQLKKVEQEYHCTGVREPKEATGVLKQLLNKENPVWSEEDEKMLSMIIEDFGCGKTSNILQENWLNSLNDRMKKIK